MRILVLVLSLIVVGPAVAAAADAEKPQTPAQNKSDKVNPAAYRILVKYDDYTLDAIRKEIRKEVVKALEARRRRLNLSQEQASAQLEKELDKYEEELEAIKKARKQEHAWRKRGDLAEAEKWRRLKLERTRRALDLARRASLIEDALVALSLENWRTDERRERAIARKALKRLEAMMEEIRSREEAERRQRGRAVAPPHE